MVEMESNAAVEEFLSAENMERVDESVSEVFGMMLGFATTVVETATSHDPSEQPERTAIVGFSGAMRGSFGIRMSSQGAVAVASAMLGGGAVEDDSVDDALGELCNMLAGGWKGRVAELDSHCLLSPPAVISGGDYRIHVRSASVAVSRTYQFEQFTITVTMVRDQPANA